MLFATWPNFPAEWTALCYNRKQVSVFYLLVQVLTGIHAVVFKITHWCYNSTLSIIKLVYLRLHNQQAPISLYSALSAYTGRWLWWWKNETINYPLIIASFQKIILFNCFFHLSYINGKTHILVSSSLTFTCTKRIWYFSFRILLIFIQIQAWKNYGNCVNLWMDQLPHKH